MDEERVNNLYRRLQLDSAREAAAGEVSDAISDEETAQMLLMMRYWALTEEQGWEGKEQLGLRQS